MSFKININPTNNSKLSNFDPNNISFGKVFTDHMFICDFYDNAWHDLRIVPFGKIPLSPTLSALHYGQSIFEGMKAYKNEDGIITFFRPDENLKRLNRSAERMSMPALPEGIFMSALEELIKLDKEWIPTAEGSSLYIRPFMFATDDFLGVKSSDNYSFMIYACPVSSYYAGHIKVRIEDKYTRAAPGGVGSAKCAGNYAASLYPRNLAQKDGFDQVLWTDGLTHSIIEETGTSNVFIVTKDGVLTPKLTDTLLPGITRKSVIQLIKDRNIQIEERNIYVKELIDWYEKGELIEMFVTGTAATITNIDTFGYLDKKFPLQVEDNMLGSQLKSELEKIKTLQLEDKHNWIVKLNLSEEVVA
ncbi:MAG: branched-chain amino acid aminotransferase [Bacteroidota bacterium]|nr:branched-chain amino acid aminotransferase [Bacteroidota bacterium]